MLVGGLELGVGLITLLGLPLGLGLPEGVTLGMGLADGLALGDGILLTTGLGDVFGEVLALMLRTRLGDIPFLDACDSIADNPADIETCLSGDFDNLYGYIGLEIASPNLGDTEAPRELGT